MPLMIGFAIMGHWHIIQMRNRLSTESPHLYLFVFLLVFALFLDGIPLSWTALSSPLCYTSSRLVRAAVRSTAFRPS